MFSNLLCIMFNDFKVDLPYLPWTSELWISLIVLQEAMRPVIIAVYCMDLVCLIPFPAKDSTTWLGEHPQYSFSFCSLRWFGDLEGFDCRGLDPIYQLYWMRSTLVHVRLILMNYRRRKKKSALTTRLTATSLQKGVNSKPGSLGTVRKDEGSQPMGVGGPPCRVPSSRDQSQTRHIDSLPVATRLSKSGQPCFSGGVLTSLAGFLGLMNGLR